MRYSQLLWIGFWISGVALAESPLPVGISSKPVKNSSWGCV